MATKLDAPIMRKRKNQVTEELCNVLTRLRSEEFITPGGIRISLRKLPKSITGNPRITASFNRRPWRFIKT